MSLTFISQPDEQPDSWHTAKQLAELFPKSIGRLDEVALQGLATRAAGIAKRLNIAPRRVEQEHHRYKAVSVRAYPRRVWEEARGVTPAPEGLAPIPTEYAGILYRSRLEARTAVRLTVLGLQFEYEPEHDEHPSGRYLPDFLILLNDEWTWLEVKHPRALAERRDPRWSELVLRQRIPIVVSYGLWRPVPFADSGPARMFLGE